MSERKNINPIKSEAKADMQELLERRDKELHIVFDSSLNSEIKKI